MFSRRSRVHCRMERGFVQIPRGQSPSQQRHTNVDGRPIQVFHIRTNDFSEADKRLRYVRRHRVQSSSIRRRHVQRSVQPARRVQDHDTEKRYTPPPRVRCSRRDIEFSFTVRMLNFYFHAENFETKCSFPLWLTEYQRWRTLDHGKTFTFPHHHNNSTLKLVSNSMDHAFAAQTIQTTHQFFYNQPLVAPLPGHEMKLSCQQEVQVVPADRFKVMAHYVTGW